jgi:hypothetical protein
MKILWHMKMKLKHSYRVYMLIKICESICAAVTCILCCKCLCDE